MDALSRTVPARLLIRRVVLTVVTALTVGKIACEAVAQANMLAG